ncbi:unnamed protein product [Dicrocoelium dendriticum]|nr:unnamed protein product [Dicrocoelium dendriticum]
MSRRCEAGDPLSPLFFIIVMDEVIAATLPNREVRLCGEEIGALVYADDLVLFASSQEALSAKLVALQQSLSAAGIEEGHNEAEGPNLREVEADGQRYESNWRSRTLSEIREDKHRWIFFGWIITGVLPFPMDLLTHPWNLNFHFSA